MNDQMMRLAIEAGFLDGDLELFPETIERFADLVRRNERALAKPEQEPYCWVQSKLNQGLFYKEKPRRIHTIPLFTAPPPKREWVGLTDDEIKNILDCGRGGLVDIKKAEQILKEKNT